MLNLKDLYSELISNRRPDLDAWYQEYKIFHREVSFISSKLGAGGTLAEKETYQDTRFHAQPNPQLKFLEELIYSDSNGISNVGLSILSRENFDKLIAHPDFIPALVSLLTNPIQDTFNTFRETWERIRIGLHFKGTLPTY